jgi:hypothetical protein
MFFSSGVRRDVDVVILLGPETRTGRDRGNAGADAAQAVAGEEGRGTRNTRGNVGPRTVWISGASVRHLRPDERNIACVLQTAVWAYSGRIYALSKRAGAPLRLQHAAGGHTGAAACRPCGMVPAGTMPQTDSSTAAWAHGQHDEPTLRGDQDSRKLAADRGDEQERPTGGSVQTGNTGAQLQGPTLQPARAGRSLEIPDNVRQLLGEDYLRCLKGWRVSNQGLAAVLHLCLSSAPLPSNAHAQGADADQASCPPPRHAEHKDEGKMLHQESMMLHLLQKPKVEEGKVHQQEHASKVHEQQYRTVLLQLDEQGEFVSHVLLR